VDVIAAVPSPRGEDPGNEELRQREEVREVDDADHRLPHQLWRVADKHGQREIVDNEEDRGRDDEARLGGHQVLEVFTFGDAVPDGGVAGVFRRRGIHRIFARIVHHTPGKVLL
jgi:hypothetical protein